MSGPTPTNGAALDPMIRAALGFLRAGGWRQERVETRLPVQFWQQGRSEVMVPLRAGAADFSRRWSDLVSDLATATEREVEDVDRELSTAQYDVLNFRAVGVQEDEFTIPVVDGVELLTSAKSLIVAAACSTLERRPYHGKSRPRVALEQGRLMRLAQTRKGSYIVPILSPVLDVAIEAQDAEDQTLLPDIERQLFPRRVMQTAADALTTLYEVGVQAASVPTVPTLAEAVGRHGLSAELCTAVAGIVEAPDVAALDIGFRWSFLVAPPASGAVSVQFSKDTAGVIREIGSRLRSEVTVNERLIYGQVTSLERDPGEDEGTVTIKAMVGNRVRPIKLVLGGDEYHVATQAHDERQRIMVSGSLQDLTGQTLRMTDVRFFRVEDSLDSVEQPRG